VILHRHIGLIQLGGLDLFRLGAPHADTDSAIRSFALYDASVNAPNRRSNRAHVFFVDLPGLTHRAKLRPAPWRSKRRVYVIVAHHPNSPSSASPSRSRAGQTSIFSSPVPRKVSLGDGVLPGLFGRIERGLFRGIRGLERRGISCVARWESRYGITRDGAGDGALIGRGCAVERADLGFLGVAKSTPSMHRTLTSILSGSERGT